jgi:tRNA A37 methylthiotransferase MiaB
MVGFPGETDEEFQDSIKLLDILEVDMTEVYKFSPRIGTQAALLPDPVPEEIASERYNTMLKKSIFSYWKSKNKEIARHERLLQSLPQNLVLPKYPKILQN